MKIFTLKRRLMLPIAVDDAWQYFSNPNNLSRITPPNLSLHIKTACDGSIYNGMIIEYDVRPLLNIPMTWLTEIKHVQAPLYFVDEQRFGPYSFWYHQHSFKQLKNGTEVVDEVHYGLPLCFLSGIMNEILIKKKLDYIFNYRTQSLTKQFGRIH